MQDWLYEPYTSSYVQKVASGVRKPGIKRMLRIGVDSYEQMKIPHS